MEQEVMDETIELLQELIRNKCVNPPGNEMKNIQTIAAFLDKKEISYEIFESDNNRGNLIAELKGTAEGPRLMLGPAHVDVVPVENPNDWSVDPFSGIIKDDYVWGRGSLDMLFMVAAQVQAFCLMAKEKKNFHGDLVLTIVSDEETGGRFGTNWLMKNQSEKMVVDYAVGETGGIPGSKNNFAVINGEKGGSPVRISFSGTPGHGSMPFGSDNAVIKAGKAAEKIADYNPPVTTKYLKKMAKALGMGFFIRLLLGSKLFLPIVLRLLKKRNIAIAKTIHGLTRMTFSPNILKGGIKFNSIPAKAHLDIDIRTLPGQDSDYVKKHLKKALGKSLAQEASIEFISKEGPISFGNSSSDKGEFVDLMVETIQELIPKAKVHLLLFPAVTDLRFLREKGVAAYGFSLYDPAFSMNELTNRAHGTNERVNISTIEYTLKAYYLLAKKCLLKS